MNCICCGRKLNWITTKILKFSTCGECRYLSSRGLNLIEIREYLEVKI